MNDPQSGLVSKEMMRERFLTGRGFLPKGKKTVATSKANPKLPPSNEDVLEFPGTEVSTAA